MEGQSLVMSMCIELWVYTALHIADYCIIFTIGNSVSYRNLIFMTILWIWD